MIINLVDRLDREWATLVQQQTDITRWTASCPPLAGCTSLDQVLEAVPAAPDDILAFLIYRFQAGDQTAGRTVLQTMLGKLVKMSYTGIAAEQHHALDDLVTCMWCRIAQYPLASRPIRVAANLALDTLKDAHAEWRTDVDVPVPTTVVIGALDETHLNISHRAAPSAEDLIAAALQLGLITSTTHDILLSVYGPEELTGKLAAQRWSCSQAAIRTRCKDAVNRRLKPHIDALLAA